MLLSDDASDTIDSIRLILTFTRVVLRPQTGVLTSNGYLVSLVFTSQSEFSSRQCPLTLTILLITQMTIINTTQK